MYSNPDTDWDLSAKGNYWRRFNGKLLVTGTADHKNYWAMIDKKFLKNPFRTIEEAQAALEDEAKDELSW